MPIEFQCKACMRTLRVPDGTAGRLSRCPSCSEQVRIPSASEPASNQATNQRAGVPCPKCKSILVCDSSLDGTRGCCLTCTHVFTIRLNPGSQDSLENESVFAFACPKCNQLFEGTPDKEGKKGKCTHCAEVFTIERYIPVKIVAAPLLRKQEAAKPKSQPSKPKRLPEIPVKKTATKSAPSNADLGFPNLADFLPPPNSGFAASNNTASVNTWTPPSSSASAYFQPAPTVAKSPRRKQQGGSGVKMLLSILGAMVVVCILLCCGGGGGLYYYIASAKTISAGGYSADAPGMPFEPKVKEQSVAGKAISNPRTRSEFMIATVTPPNAQGVTVDDYVENLKAAGLISSQETSPLTRAGLRGYRVRMRGVAGTAPNISEIYNLNGKILMLVYVNGVLGSKMKGLRTSLSESQAEAIDNPDAFFESLRAAP